MARIMARKARCCLALVVLVMLPEPPQAITARLRTPVLVAIWVKTITTPSYLLLRLVQNVMKASRISILMVSKPKLRKC